MKIEFACPCEKAGSTVAFGPHASFKVPATGAWTSYHWLAVDTLDLAKGQQTVRLSVKGLAHSAALNIRGVKLRIK